MPAAGTRIYELPRAVLRALPDADLHRYYARLQKARLGSWKIAGVLLGRREAKSLMEDELVRRAVRNFKP